MQQGKIILLNGASSSGKTSILKALQAQLYEPYLDAGLDRFIWMLPRRYLDRPLWDEVLGLADRAGAAGMALVHGMHQAAVSLSHCGLNVIMDHVLVEVAWRDECAALFAGLPVYWIGVRCPLEVLEERELARKDRTLGQARLQYGIVHRGITYHLEVDTSVQTAEQCAAKIKELVESNPLPAVLHKPAAIP